MPARNIPVIDSIKTDRKNAISFFVFIINTPLSESFFIRNTDDPPALFPFLYMLFTQA